MTIIRIWLSRRDTNFYRTSSNLFPLGLRCSIFSYTLYQMQMKRNSKYQHFQTWKPWCFLCKAWTLLRSRAPSSLNIRAASFSWIQALVSSTFRLKAWISLARSSASSRELVLSFSVSHMEQTSSIRFSIACCNKKELWKQRPLLYLSIKTLLFVEVNSLSYT